MASSESPQETLLFDTRSSFVSTYTMDTTYSIEVVEGPHQGMNVPLAQELTQVGRRPFMDVMLDQDKHVSYRHCEFKLEEGGVRVRDLGSSNGISIQGCRIYDAFLAPDVPLQVGKSVLVLRAQSASQEIQINHIDKSGQLVGKSDSMKSLFRLLERLAQIDLPVLLLGETGVGKTSVASAIHAQSERADGPFVEVNCAAFPDELIEAELFGYERGAFTGAERTHKGCFEQAHGGTLFLDEVGELPLSQQKKLLSAVERGAIKRLGAERSIKVDFRLICATNISIAEAIQERTFREDLYYRIAVGELEIPPLRERSEDIPLLIEHMLQQLDTDQPIAFSQEALEELQRHSWPGNIRELHNTIQRTRLMMHGENVLPEHIRFQGPIHSDSLLQEARAKTLPLAIDGGASLFDLLCQYPALTQEPRLTLKEATEQVERALLSQALEETDGNVSAAAQLLGIKRSWAYTLLKRHQLTTSKG